MKLSNPVWEKLIDKCNTKGVMLAEYPRMLIEADAEGTFEQIKDAPINPDNHPMKA